MLLAYAAKVPKIAAISKAISGAKVLHVQLSQGTAGLMGTDGMAESEEESEVSWEMGVSLEKEMLSELLAKVYAAP